MASRTTSWAGTVLGFVAAYFAVGALLPRQVPAAERVERVVPSEALETERPASLMEVETGERPDAAAEPAAPAPPAPAVPVAAEAAAAPRASDSPALVYGTVTDLEGSPLGRVAVLAEQPGGDQVRASTDARGRYVLASISRGTKSLTAGSLMHRTLELPLDLASSEAGVGTRKDLVLSPKRMVRVRLVTRAGEPAIPAIVAAGHSPWRVQLVPVATAEEPGATFTGVTGSLNNPFGIGAYWQSGRRGMEPATDDEYGLVMVHQDGPAWLSLVASHQVLASRRIDDDTRSVEFVLDPEDLAALRGTVRLAVVDAQTGAPLAARASVGRNSFRNGGDLYETDPATGAVTLQGVAPGKSWLVVQAEGRATYKQRIVVERGAALEIGQVALHAPVEIRGVTCDADGKPYEAVVKWGRLDDATGRVDWAEQTFTESGTDGAFWIRDLEPGVYAVQAPGLPAPSPRPHDARLATSAVRVDAREGSVQDVVLELRATSKLTLVTGDLEDPWATARAIDASGLPADSTWLGRWGAEIDLDLIDGSYTLVVRRDGDEIERRDVVIAGEDVRLELEIETGGGE
ncbi:MAG: carboxypeptidase-like regulatory domain-containing protein [Planctomycetota bacterium]